MNWTDLTWPEIKALAPHTPLVIPVAAIEQHGHHLPVATDSMLLGEVIRRVSEKLNDKVLFAPLQWLGNSDHHMDFSGTLSARPRTYLDLLGEAMENGIIHGFRRIGFVSDTATAMICCCCFQPTGTLQSRGKLAAISYNDRWGMPANLKRQ